MNYLDGAALALIILLSVTVLTLVYLISYPEEW